MTKMLENYESALQRLIQNKPTSPKLINTKFKINKATVAIEAGRVPSSIRNDNAEFDELRVKIKQAEILRKSLLVDGKMQPQKVLKEVLSERKDEIKELKKSYDILLIQINSLIVENKNLKEMLRVYRDNDKLVDFKKN